MSANSLQTGIWIVDKDSNMLFGMPVVPVTWCVLWAAINGFALTFGMCTIIYDKKRAPAAQIILAFLNCVYAPPWGPGAVSYTHLDVYKRQETFWAVLCFLLTVSLLRERRNIRLPKLPPVFWAGRWKAD